MVKPYISYVYNMKEQQWRIIKTELEPHLSYACRNLDQGNIYFSHIYLPHHLKKHLLK